MRFLLILFSYFLVSVAEARLGETSIQFADRYGRPKDSSLTKISDTQFPLVEGATHHTYEYQGWKIRAAFLQLDGPAVRMDYQKTTSSPAGLTIRDDEVQAIASANTPDGMSWKRVLYNNPDSPNGPAGKVVEAYLAGSAGQKMWQRTDGAILWLRSNLIVRLELPVAREHEAQLKFQKEQKARASVPKF
jgi:hypothetical protein